MEVVDRLSALLYAQGYMRLESNMNEFLLFLAGNFERARLIEVIDLSRGFQITREQLQTVENNTKTAFEDQGYRNLHFFTLVVTDREDNDTLEACSSEWGCWVVNTAQKKILMQDDQAEDFYGLRTVVERAMSDEEIPIPEVRAVGAAEKERSGIMGVIRKNYTHVNTLIVTINVIVFLILSFMGDTESAEFMAQHGAMFAPSIILDGEYYRLITSMFLHFGIDHLLGNMIALYFLGDNLERAVGKIKYLIIYFISGILAGIGSMIYYLVLREPVVAAGASGAIFGVIGAMLYIVIRNKGKLEDLTTFRIIIFIAYCIYSGLTSPTTDNVAHLCGLLVGFLLSIILYRKPKKQKDGNVEGIQNGN